MKKKALITGVTGQDGAYLSKFLLSKNYHIDGGYRANSQENLNKLKALHIENDINYVNLDLTDIYSVYEVIKKNEISKTIEHLLT